MTAMWAVLTVLTAAARAGDPDDPSAWDVPGRFATIQEAIDAASDGDTITVGPYDFHERVDFKGKAITVRGCHPGDPTDSRRTRIFGGYNGSCVKFVSGETRDSVLEGVTLRSGEGTAVYYRLGDGWFSGSAGGGILCVDSSPTIRGCTMGQSYAVYGAGIALIGQCNALVRDCVIAYNRCWGWGSAIYARAAEPQTAASQIINCTIFHNQFESFSDYREAFQVDCGYTPVVLANTIIAGLDKNLLIADPCLVSHCHVTQAYLYEGAYDPKPTVYPLAGWQGNLSRGPTIVGLVVVGSYPQRTDYLDWRLRADSVCLEAGDPCFAGYSAVDIGGQPRVMVERVDIGADEMPQTLVVTHPDAGRVWSAGSEHEIQWRRHGVGPVDVLFSEDAGQTWDALASGVADVGRVMCRMPGGVDSNECLVRISPVDSDPYAVYIGGGPFTVRPDAAGPAVESTWSTLGGRFTRSGMGGVSGPNIGCVRWKLQTQGAVVSSVTAGFDQRTHIASGGGMLYTVDRDGNVVWTYDAGRPLLSSPSVGPDGSVYAGDANGVLHVLDINGRVRWTCRTGGSISAAPAVAADGRVFLGSQDGWVYGLEADGGDLWRFKTAGMSIADGAAVFASPSIGADGTVYVAGLYDPNLYALDANTGAVRWVCHFDSGGLPFASPVVAGHGTIYQTLLFDSRLYAIEPVGGTIVWATDLADPDSPWFDGDLAAEPDGVTEPVVGPDGTIYVGLDDPYLRAVDPNGAIRWVERLGDQGAFTLAVGPDGVVYAAGEEGRLYVFDGRGFEIARFEGTGWLSYPVTVGTDLLVFSDSNDHSVLFEDSNDVVWAVGGMGARLSRCLVVGGDINGDGNVDFQDFALLVGQWLECTDPACGYQGPPLRLPADIDGDLYVYLPDLIALAQRWLGHRPTDPLPAPSRPPLGWPWRILTQAGSPLPPDGAYGVDPLAPLSWQPGQGATERRLYFGTECPPPFLTTLTTTTYYVAGLIEETSYWWRVDEVGPSGVTTGPLWTFVTGIVGGAASVPQPSKGATGVSKTAVLSWQPGARAVSHDVYFGTVNPPPFLGNQVEPVFAPGVLALSQTYFWRVDEVRDGGLTPGPVWYFTTTSR